MNFYIQDQEAREETALFHRQSLWLEEDLYASKFKHFLSPHSNNFYSELRGLFSFEVMKLEGLNYFNFISLRDGLLPLMSFFSSHPEPGPFKKTILVHKNMAPVVPAAWQNQVSYYDFHALKKKDNPYLVLSLFAEEHQLNLKDLRDLLNNELSHYEEIQVLLIKPTLRGEDELEGQSLFAQEVIAELCEIRKDMSFVNFNQLMTQNLSQYDFLDVNPHRFWYSWSFIEQSLAQKGAQLISHACDQLPEGVEQLPGMVMTVQENSPLKASGLDYSGYTIERQGQSYDEISLFPADLLYLAKKAGALG